MIYMLLKNVQEACVGLQRENGGLMVAVVRAALLMRGSPSWGLVAICGLDRRGKEEGGAPGMGDCPKRKCFRDKKKSLVRLRSGSSRRLEQGWFSRVLL